MGGQRVLIVEDDPDVRGLIRLIVERSGLEASEAADGAEGLRRFYSDRPDLVVLDVSMPELDGWQVLQRIREMSEVPVLMLAADAGEVTKVRGLTEGADDYVTKPFGRQELIARIEALLRRSGGRREEPEMHVDRLLEIDFPKRRVTAGGVEVALTPTEFRLLGVLARHPNQVLGHDQLLELVWGRTGGGASARVKLYVGYLRRKLREAAGVEPIETVRGFGYRYRP